MLVEYIIWNLRSEKYLFKGSDEVLCYFARKMSKRWFLFYRPFYVSILLLPIDPISEFVDFIKRILLLIVFRVLMVA